MYRSFVRLTNMSSGSTSVICYVLLQYSTTKADSTVEACTEFVGMTTRNI